MYKRQGKGRTNQTVKGNWDLIQDLALKIAAMGTSIQTDARYNIFKVDLKRLTGDEQFEGIYDPKMARFVI